MSKDLAVQHFETALLPPPQTIPSPDLPLSQLPIQHEEQIPSSHQLHEVPLPSQPSLLLPKLDTHDQQEQQHQQQQHVDDRLLKRPLDVQQRPQHQAQPSSPTVTKQEQLSSPVETVAKQEQQSSPVETVTKQEQQPRPSSPVETATKQEQIPRLSSSVETITKHEQLPTGTPPRVQVGEQKQQSVARELQPFSPSQQSQLVYPAALATHDAVVADETLFRETLHSFHAALGVKPPIPKIGGKDLNLHMLYKEVTSQGGLEAVIKDRKWREIASAFNFPPAKTSASYVLRKYYISLLRHYEQVYLFGVQGQIVPPPANLSSSSPVNCHIASQLEDKEPSLEVSNDVEFGMKKTRGIIDSAQALGVDPASSIGTVVTGSIDGKFEHGYLVTVMVGTRKMRGVLYHVASTNPVPQNASVHALMKCVGSELKSADLGPSVGQKRRRRDVSRKDPDAPRQNRTGYNYFFAEQRAKLKKLQPDKDRAVSKMIGDLWSGLSEHEKSPYQEQGLKDKERYKTEMREYREKLKLQLAHDRGSRSSNMTLY